jgi:hypothetical protein
LFLKQFINEQPTQINHHGTIADGSQISTTTAEGMTDEIIQKVGLMKYLFI